MTRTNPAVAPKIHTVLYRVLFHHFERFLTEYDRRIERECRTDSFSSFLTTARGRDILPFVMRRGDFELGAGPFQPDQKSNFL